MKLGHRSGQAMPVMSSGSGRGRGGSGRSGSLDGHAGNAPFAPAFSEQRGRPKSALG